MKIPLSWLAEFIDVPSDIDSLRETMDDLGLVVEGVEHVGAGLEDVVVARVEEIHAIEGADRIRRVIVTAGDGPVEIVCGAMNFDVGHHVPLAPVGAVLPGDFVIAQRKMRGVVSNGMLCSGRELGLGEDHGGLLLLDDQPGVAPGQRLLDLLGIAPDVVFDISPEGNRPDAWSVEGVARDIAARLGLTMRDVDVAEPNGTAVTSTFATGSIAAPELCGALLVSALRNVTVCDSPRWLQRRLEMAGMRAVSNVVDASNYVMLELGQPTHPYDAAQVAGRHIGVRQARPGEVLTTLDDTERVLGQPGRGLGDTGVDCVIVDGTDTVIGLAGIMGGASSEISPTTTDVILEAAFFTPMVIARTSKRLSLRSEASSRFERGVDPTLAARATARFVALLSLTSPDLEWLPDPVRAAGVTPEIPEIVVSQADSDALLGTHVPVADAERLLSAIGFSVQRRDDVLTVSPSPARLDVRAGLAGRADVIEEIARLFSYRRLERRTPTWPTPGGLNARQQLRRTLRDVVIGLGGYEAWTPTLGSDDDFDLLHPDVPRVRITNPLAADESVLRASHLVGLVKAWGRNAERGLGDVTLFEIGTVVQHPSTTPTPREARGGVDGASLVPLPIENERLMILWGREGDDARTAVAAWSVIAQRLRLLDVVVRASTGPRGWHPTRYAQLVDRETGAVVGSVGEVDPDLASTLAPSGRAVPRLAVLDVDVDLLADSDQVRRQSSLATVPSRFPAAAVDLAFVVPNEVNALDLAASLRSASDLVESVELFDVFRGDSLGTGVRSLAYAIRFAAFDRTLSESDVADARGALIAAAASWGAVLR